MTTLYKKVGRRYKPVAEHEEWDSYPAGAHLVICQPGSTMRRFNVDPDRAGLLAAADAVIAERDEIRNALQCLLNALPSATTHPAIKSARAAIARATGEQP